MAGFLDWDSNELEIEYDELQEEIRNCPGGPECECETLRYEKEAICEILEDRGVW